ncbi:MULTISPECIES: thiolase family protein [Auritidibacter]|uniref:thiolase family protein n=1 Tax=Auritidibacter TaxID=1160973 RepID=UPI000D72878F|nr:MULTISPECIES: thiolase family protein [Auritidibacter]PXA76126.1 3-oxoadipyl-CoA thiolase [Auritidibacter sp. NML120779]NIH70548.1 acetyl-CoA C-acetyltransferase [Auritidibacter ignavus]PXA81465.1 3-oxoadipyl-CoA thiolase [Auritidibacter sp. NML120636]RMX23268.1 thiolase family protein [Auritidibacter ignavus]WGH91394.1 thiolase family protein [Auritidibacter ignavus]
MTALQPAYVYDAVRTPFGKIGGGLAAVRPDDLAAHVIGELVKRAPNLPNELSEADQIDEVIFGNANGAGEDNRNVARMATLLAGLPVSIPGTTVNRLCGSSLDAAMVASRQVEVGDADLILTGGVESMSRAPWVLPKTDRPFPMYNLQLSNTALGWRLINDNMPAEWTVSLGEATEQLREKFGITRERMDDYAARSHQLAATAWDNGTYDNLVSPVVGTELHRDETIRPECTPETLAGLRTVFRKDHGTVTAGNASPMNDGAATVWIGSGKASEILGLEPLVRIAGRAASANEPQFFGYAPVEATNRAIARAGITWDDIAAVELNEAFAAQTLVCLDAWGVDQGIVNTWGGAIALGHPLGASGARVLGTLARRLHESGDRWGVACLCIGVGQGLAVVVENINAH